MPLKTAWKKFISREGVDVTTLSHLDVVFYDCIRQSYRHIKEPFFTHLAHRIMTHYLCVDPLTVGRKIYPNFFKTPALVQQKYTRGLRFLKDVQRSTRVWKQHAHDVQHDWQRAAFREFRKQFEHINYAFSIWPWWGIESWQIDAERVIGGMIARNHLEEQQDAILASVYKPWKKTAIIELQERLRHGERITSLVQEYQFLRSWSAVWYRPIDEKWVRDFAQQSKVGVHMPVISPRRLVALLRPKGRERWFLAIAPYIIFFKDWRDDVRRTHVYAWSFLFDAIARRFHVERDDIGYLTIDEIDTMLATNIFPRAIVARRKKHPCIITAKGSFRTMQALDTKIAKYTHIVQQASASAGRVTEARGLVAQRGNVRGVVRIVKTYHDIKKFNVGEVLIANTTHPNYIPAMQKAIAFVTNEGGVVSHAAIVARELKKPCIVGTKTATQIFKDGDMVEVDATAGIVRKIS